MSDKPDNANEQLERLLRRWGAEEAVRQAQVPPAPAPPARRGRAAQIVLRWAPLAAAAVLLVGAGWLYLAAQSARRAMEGAAATPVRIEDVHPPRILPTTLPQEAQLAALRKELTEKDQQLKALGDLPQKLREAEDALELARRRHQTDVRELMANVEARQKETKGLAEKLTAAEQQVAALAKDKQALASAAAELPKAQQEVKGLQQRLAAAVNEMSNLRHQREEAEAAVAEARREAQLLAARHTEIVAAFQRTYLAAIAPGERGMEARKTAARARRMIERCTELSGDARSDSTRRLLARLEAVLTRLDLLDPQRIGSEEAFLQLLGRADLAKEIDAVLVEVREPQDLRTWLFEAKLILMGAGHAG